MPYVTYATNGVPFKVDGHQFTTYYIPDFLFTIDTRNLSTGSSADNQFSLPIILNGSYNMTVDWGDDTSTTITTWSQADKLHSYAIPGVHTVRITGQCRGWRFNNAGDKLKILDISNWGTSFRLATLTAAGGNYFQGCANLTITANDNLDLTAATNLNSMFSGCASLTTAPTMALWDTSQVTIATAMFSGCSAFNQPIGSWNTANVNTMSGMFNAATVFNQPVGNWNTANVTNMSGMFNAATAFNQPLDSWNVSKVTGMDQMFTKTYAFKQNLGAWAPLALTNANVMFYSSDMNAPGTTTLYDALLNGWAAQAVLNNVPFGAGSSKYSAAAADARSHLTTTHGWTIADGGLAA